MSISDTQVIHIRYTGDPYLMSSTIILRDTACARTTWDTWKIDFKKTNKQKKLPQTNKKSVVCGSTSRLDPALGRQREMDLVESEASLIYIVRPCLKQINKMTQTHHSLYFLALLGLDRKHVHVKQALCGRTLSPALNCPTKNGEFHAVELLEIFIDFFL